MKRTLNQLVWRFFPLIMIWRERIQLNQADQIICDTSSLACINELKLEDVFSSETLAAEWEQVEKEIEDFSTRSGGVNQGDRRAIYYLVRYLQPKSILEIGTHVGASTIAMAAAQRALNSMGSIRSFALTTVDIQDINDPVSRPWLAFGSKFSPKDLVTRMGCENSVKFVVSNSFDFFASNQARFDFIFLDGNHRASVVYREISLALRSLTPEGYILLHDYYPSLQQLMVGGNLVPGPWLAVSRLIQEGARIVDLPLGELPWETKLGSRYTSLALLGTNILKTGSQPKYVP